MLPKILFFGSSDYCLPILESLRNNFQLIALVTKKGQAVGKYSSSHNIKVLAPQGKQELLSLKNQILSLAPELAIVADYGLIIPKEIFSIPRYKTLNIHFSKLPALRGPSPVQYTILLGEKSAFISVIVMDEEMDTGDIVWQKEIKSFNSQHSTFNINNETTDSLYKKLFNIVSSDLPDVINKYVKNELKPQKQNHSLATYTKHFTREDGFIPSYILSAAMAGKPKIKINKATFPKNSAIFSPLKHCDIVSLVIDRALRAFSPWPGLWTQIHLTFNRQHLTRRFKILQAHLEGEKLIFDLVQMEGKRPVGWKQFQVGYPNFTL